MEVLDSSTKQQSNDSKIENKEVEKNDRKSGISISVTKSTFLSALTNMYSVIDKKTNISILTHVKLEMLDPLNIAMTATDCMEITITENISVNKIIGTGGVALPLNMMIEVIRKLSDDEVIRLDVSANVCTIFSGEAKFELGCLDISLFPKLEQQIRADLLSEFSINSKDMFSVLNKTQFAISSEGTRYYLNGLCLQLTSDSKDSSKHILSAVAVDGHRLAQYKLTLEKDCVVNDQEAIETGVIIPRKTVIELRKLLIKQNQDEEISLVVSIFKNRISFTIDKITLISKLIDGHFPDCDKVIPNCSLLDPEKSINIEKNLIAKKLSDQDLHGRKIFIADLDSFASAVDRVSSINFNKVRSINFMLSEGSVMLTSISSEANSTAEDKIAIIYNGDKYKISFNARYLLDVFSHISSSKIAFSIGEETQPVLIKSLDDTNALYIVMPIKI